MNLKKSLRIRRRYLLLDNASRALVEKVILDYIGILGWARATPVFLNKGDKTILSVDRKELNEIRAALEMSKKKIKILKVSGTLRSL